MDIKCAIIYRLSDIGEKAAHAKSFNIKLLILQVSNLIIIFWLLSTLKRKITIGPIYSDGDGFSLSDVECFYFILFTTKLQKMAPSVWRISLERHKTNTIVQSNTWQKISFVRSIDRFFSTCIYRCRCRKWIRYI